MHKLETGAELNPGLTGKSRMHSFDLLQNNTFKSDRGSAWERRLGIWASVCTLGMTLNPSCLTLSKSSSQKLGKKHVADQPNKTITIW